MLTLVFIAISVSLFLSIMAHFMGLSHASYWLPTEGFFQIVENVTGTDILGADFSITLFVRLDAEVDELNWATSVSSDVHNDSPSQKLQRNKGTNRGVGEAV